MSLSKSCVTVGVISNQHRPYDCSVRVAVQNSHKHKDVLMSSNDNLGIPKSQTGSVKINGLNITAVMKLLEYQNTKKLDISMENVQIILVSACALKMPEAIKICTDFMNANLNSSNWNQIASFYRANSLTEAVDGVQTYVQSNLQSILKNLNPWEKSVDDLCLIIDAWQDSEWDLFCTVQAWIEEYNMKINANVLMEHLRFGLMTPSELESIQKMKMYRDCVGPWCELVSNALIYHTKSVNKKVLDTSIQTQFRTGPSLVCFNDRQGPSGTNFYALGKDRTWKHQQGFNPPPTWGVVHGTCTVNNFLIICVGEDLDWYVYDVRLNTWSEIAPMEMERFNFTLVSTDGKLFTLGGCTVEDRFLELVDGEALNCVEQYDFDTGSWVETTPLLGPVRDAGACVLAGAVYVSGGYGSGLPFADPMDILDCFDLSTHSWTEREPMLQPRAKHGMDVMKRWQEDVIVVADKELDFEFYSPSSNQWTKCTFIYTARNPMPIDTFLIDFSKKDAVEHYPPYYEATKVVVIENSLIIFELLPPDSYMLVDPNFPAEWAFPETGQDVPVTLVESFPLREKGREPEKHVATAVICIPSSNQIFLSAENFEL